MEEIKLRGRPRKPRVGILSGDQVAALQTPQQIAERDRKDQDAARKREERARERVQREFGFIETMEALWAHNRELLTESESNLRVKDHQTRDLWNWIELVLEGSDISRDPDGPSKAEGISAVNAHVAEFGTCNPEIALIEQFWKLPLYENLKGGTETFAKFGLFISLPEIRVMQLREMLQQPPQEPARQRPSGETAPPSWRAPVIR